MTRSVKQYIGIQFNATVVFGYSFREGGTEVFRITCLVAPDPDIMLFGFQKKLWHRNFDGQITLVPGARRNVVDESGNVHGHYEYAGKGEFRIVTGKTAACVQEFSDGWKVFTGTDLTAEILCLAGSKRKQFEENGYIMEERFLINVFEDTAFSLYPYIMAIPMLGF